jgi:tetratricopeptide (TPR) repeat protein
MSEIVRVRQALEAQKKVEQDFVEEARRTETAPKGWPAALVMFHLGMWRERMRKALTDLSESREPNLPSESLDEINDAELASGIGTPLADAAARSEHLLGEIMDLYDWLGDRPFQWYRAKTTTEAVLGNSFTHPRGHLYEYLRENGDIDRANRLWEEAVTLLREVNSPPLLIGASLYNLACARAYQGRLDEALVLLEEAFPMRPDFKERAPKDSDLEALHDDARLKALIAG